MTVKIAKYKLTLLTLCLGLAMTSSAMAAGYGVQDKVTPQAAAIDHLLTSANSNINNMVAPKKAPVRSSAPVASGKTSQPAASAGMSEQAFARMAKNMMPLTPQQIRTLHYLFNKSQKAASEYPGLPPKPTSSSVLVNLSPGAAPPIVRLRAGYVTSLVFLDSTGQPWPVVAYDLGNPKAFNLQPNQPNGKSDTILVEALDTYKSGNLAVMLKGLNTPVMITLMPGQRAVDYRVDMRVPGLGPNAKPMLSGLPNTGNPKLLTFLDGVPPSGAKAVDVSGGPAQAWIYDKKLFLRTRLTVLSPAWMATMSSPDGTHVYELTQTPVVLASERGAMVNLTMKSL